ncbi:MAG: amidophosphoribosyltransferase, partial [Clostridia bacterium]|nr:amidophosphoribosyltransferase [Clostridia bacterium]
MGTRRGGMAAFDSQMGLQRQIHNLENSPFRTKFEHVLDEMKGTSVIGIISDYDPQPLLMRSRLGTYAICVVGRIINADQLVNDYFVSTGGHFNSMSGSIVNGTEIVGALISQKDSFEEGIKFAQSVIDGTCSILILKEDGTLIVARDRYGRVPVLVGKSVEDDGFAVSFESFAYKKMGFDDYMELGPGQIVQVTADSVTELAPAGEEMRMCSFLWTYYG